MSSKIGQKKIAIMEQRKTKGWRTQKERKHKRHRHRRKTIYIHVIEIST